MLTGGFSMEIALVQTGHNVISFLMTPVKTATIYKQTVYALRDW